MKLPAIAVGVLLISLPLTASKSASPIHEPTPTTEERLFLLEQDAAEHEASDHAVQEQLTKHIDDMLRAQGRQDDRIVRLESEQAVFDKICIIAGFILTLLVPIVLWYVNDRTQERRNQHKENKKTLGDIVTDVLEIKVALGLPVSKVDFISPEGGS